MIMKNQNLEEEVREKRNTIKGERLDMSFGEIMNLYEDESLIIAPEYQRAYRWSDEQKTGFIESILLGIPVPPIFVAEDAQGKWELVDGLQRISTILSFFGKLKELKEEDKKNNFKLEKGSIIQNLENVNKEVLPLKLQNTIKRAICRVEILRWDSAMDMRYELFKRLNTTGEPLTAQEIRNCIFRGNSQEFNKLLKTISNQEKFKEVADLSERQEIEMFGEELVLKVFAFQDSYKIKDYLNEHLTAFMKKVTEGKTNFDIEENAKTFNEILKNLKSTYFRSGTRLSHRLWDAIWYPLFKGKKEKDADIDIEKFVKLVKEQIKKANISRTITHNNKAKKAIEIGMKIYKNLKNASSTYKKNSNIG